MTSEQQQQVLPSEIMEMIFHFVPSTDGNWFNVLTSCKLFHEIARRVFDPSKESNKVNSFLHPMMTDLFKGDKMGV